MPWIYLQCTSYLKVVNKYLPKPDKLSYRKNQMHKNEWEWHRSRLLPSYFLPSSVPPGNRNNFTSNFPMHISWNNWCTDKNLKCDLIKNLTPFGSAAEAEEEKKTKKKHVRAIYVTNLCLFLPNFFSATSYDDVDFFGIRRREGESHFI